MVLFNILYTLFAAYAGHISTKTETKESDSAKVSPSEPPPEQESPTVQTESSEAGSFEEVSRSEVTEPALKSSPSKVNNLL